MDNSVLFSLGELKALGDERIRTEEAAEQARVAAVERDRRDVAERAIAAAAAERRSDEERRWRQRDERERARRQEELALIQAEARMEEDAQRLVEAARLESEARVAGALRRTRPLRTVVALSVTALLAVGGFGAWLIHDEDVAVAYRRAALQQDFEADRARARDAEVAERVRLEAETARLEARVAVAVAAAERRQAEARAADAERARERRAEAERRREAVKKIVAAAPPAAGSILDGEAALGPTDLSTY